MLQSIVSHLSLTARLRHFLGSMWAAALCSARPATALCTSWTAVDPFQQPPESQMPFPNCQHRQTVVVCLVLVGCREPMLKWGAALGIPRRGWQELLLMGDVGEHGWESWLGSAESPPRGFGLILDVQRHQQCKTSRFFWKAFSYLSLKITQPVSSLLARVCYTANLAF